MANETLIARLELSLRQSRSARTRLSARLAELESESEIIRAELAEMDTLAGQTEAAIFRLLSNVMSGPSTKVGTTSVGELEIEPGLQETAWNHASAFQNEFGLGAVEKRSHFEHQASGRKTNLYSRSLAQSLHEFAVG